MAKMLLIVDPQIDFINGTLPVPGAEEAMNGLAEYVKTNGKDYTCIVITSDRHDLNHSSFVEAGGKWPAHCVISSVGAAIWPALMDALRPMSDKVIFLYKGEDRDRDEYSIFMSEDGEASMTSLINQNNINEIDICGLAGDVCVATTLEDALRLFPDIRYRILEPFTASLDNGKYISEKNRSLKGVI